MESNGERLKCFVWVSPMAWPCWLSVSQRELYLLQIQALYCRTLLKSRRNPYTPLHEYCRSLQSQAITTGRADSDQCSLTVISPVEILFFVQEHLFCLWAGKKSKHLNRKASDSSSTVEKFLLSLVFISRESPILLAIMSLKELISIS